MVHATAAHRRSALRHWLIPAVAVAALALAIVLIMRTLRRYSLDEVIASVAAMPAGHIARAGGFAAASYFCLTLFDTLAVRYAGARLPYRCTALASFVSLSLGHTIGFAALSSGTIRFRFYSRWGLRAAEVAAVILFCAITVALGLAALAGIALLADPALAQQVIGLDARLITLLGVAALAVPALYVVLVASVRRPFRVASWRFRLPRPPIAVAQIAIGVADFAMVAACLHQTLSAASDVSYLAVVSVYVIANVAAIVSHVPGGLGVIEGVVLFLLPSDNLIGPLLVFRFVYFLVPLALGAILFAASELALRARPQATRSQATRS
jgi:uncharacterized membrane protein YbhN (UPF0104 family)